VNVAMWNLRSLDRFFDVVEFISLVPLSYLVSCKLSFSIVDFKMHSLPPFALKSTNRIFT
jgi:hypothetical protein